MCDPDTPRPDSDWLAFQEARERFFARVRPEAMAEPVPSLCPEGVPVEWMGDTEVRRALKAE